MPKTFILCGWSCFQLSAIMSNRTSLEKIIVVAQMEKRLRKTIKIPLLFGRTLQKIATALNNY